MELEGFADRVFKKLPTRKPSAFASAAWDHAGRPTQEAVAIMPIPGVDPAKVIDCVMDVDKYVGNVDHVAVCRSIKDDRYTPPGAVRFYQKVDLPLLGSVHHELVLKRLGERDGFHVAGWEILRAETDKLSTKDGFRSEYSHGLWFAAPGIIAYALGSCPKRDDVGFLKWKALTTGADAAASRVLKANLEGMARWASRR